MTRSVFVRAFMLVLCVSLVTPLASRAQSTGEPLFDSDHVSSTVLGQVAVNELPPDSQLLLQSLTVAGGATLPAHVSVGPELLHVTSGSILVLDGFGFSTEIAQGSSLALNANTSYSISETAGADAEIYRLSLAPGIDETSTPANSSPPVGTVVASPMAVTEPKTLFSIPISMTGDGPWTLFLADTRWDAASVLPPQDHAGPIAVMPYGDQGLTITSQSGIQGLIKPETAVLIPKGTPIVARNDSQALATALLAGLVLPSDETLLREIIPTPTPSPTPHPTLIPTETPVPTETPLPSPTIAPTDTPLPSPTADLNTAAGSVLQLNQTWRSGNALLTVGTQNPIGCDGGKIFVFTYVNIGSERQDFVVNPALIAVSGDDGQIWSSCEYNDRIAGIPQQLKNPRVVLESGEEIAFGMGFAPAEGNETVATVTVNIPQLGEVSSAQFQFDYVQGEVRPSAES